MSKNKKQKIKSPVLPLQRRTKQLSSKDKKRKLILAVIVGVFGFLLYSNTLTHNYVLDDFSVIKENNIVRQGASAIPEIFKTSYRQGYLSIKDGLYRPLSLALFAVEWHFFPDNPAVSHFMNVLLYGITGMLLFLTLCKLFERREAHPCPPEGREKEKENRGIGEMIALIASLLFIAHPLHVEVVANIKSRDELLCFLFVICSFLLVFRFLETEKRKFLLSGMLVFFFSLLSKETSITFLALLPLSLHFFSSVPLRKNIFITLLFIVTAFVYLLIRRSVLQGALTDDTVSIADNVLTGAKTFGTHLGTAFYILGLYIKLLFFPHSLSYDYSFNQIPVVSLGNIFSVVSVLFYAAIGIFAGKILFKSFREKRHRFSFSATCPDKSGSHVLSFGIFFFLITIFLFSNLVLTIGTSMGDRLMYFPSLGFCICIAVLYVTFFMKENWKLETGNWKLYPLMAVLILFSYKTWSRNPDWKDNYTLYSHDVNLAPNSVKAHYYLGLELVKVVAAAEPDSARKRKIYEEGIAELERAVKILPTFANAYTQMGVAYYRMKNYEKAIENYNKAATLKPGDAITLNNIGTVYFEWGKYREAEEKFLQALGVDPRYVDGYMNLGSVYGTLQQYDKAIDAFLNAIKYSPDNSRAYHFLAITYQNKGDKANAEKYFQMAQQLERYVKQQ